MAKSFFKKGEITKMSKALLYNKFVLYFIFIIAVGNLFHLVFTRDLASVSVFIAAGLLTSFFSKNMIVILVVAMVVANVFRFGNGGGREGFKKRNKKDDTFENAIEELDNAIQELEQEGFSDDENNSDDEDSDSDEDTETFKRKIKTDKHNHSKPGEVGHDLEKSHDINSHTEHKK